MKKWGIGKAKTSNNLTFWFSFKTVAKVLDKDDRSLDVPLEDGEQVERTITRALVPNMLGWLTGDLKLLGFEGRNLKRLNPADPDAHDFGDVEVLAVCGEKEYPAGSGKMTEEWKLARPWKEPEKPADEEIDAHFSALQDAFETELAKAGVGQPSQEEAVTY